MAKALAYAAHHSTGPLSPLVLERREPKPTDVEIEILFCGVCHSDLHIARNEWGGTVYPIVPGHEIVGRVLRTGSEVRNFASGDLVGVGCLVDSCRNCFSCDDGLEQYCEHSWTPTYGGYDRHSGGQTQGGYSQSIVVDEHFVLRIPEDLDPAGVAPLLCAGITTYSALRTANVQPGSKVGVIGLGGVGHVAVKIATALGSQVVLFSSSPDKSHDAARLGATEVLSSVDREGWEKHQNSFDAILDTVSVGHALDGFLQLLRRDGTMMLVGAPAEPHAPLNAFSLVGRRRRLIGSMIGGIAETQEMLEFCALHGIVSDIEIIPMEEVNTAYERMLRGDVRYRFVIDMRRFGR